MRQTTKVFRNFIIGSVAFTAIFIGASIWSDKCEKKRVVVTDFQMMQNVSGDKNSVTTTYEYMVFTEQGTFKINPSGFWFAHPELIGKIHKGDTLNITVRGYECPAIGMYRIIDSIE